MLTLLYRRYYAAFAMSVAVMLITQIIFKVINEQKTTHLRASKSKNNKRENNNTCISIIGNSFINLMYIGIIDFVVLLIFFAPLVKRLFFTDYSDQYVAYAGEFVKEVKSLFDGFGYIALICIVITLILSIIRKTAVDFIVSMLVSAVVAALSFTDTIYGDTA